MTSDAVGGVWTYSLDLARSLAERNIETVLAVLGPVPSAEQESHAAEIPGLTLINTGLPLDWTAEHPSDLAAAGEALARLATSYDADLVHLNSPALAADAPFRQPLIIACHSCLATWWATVRQGELPEDFRWRTDLVRAGYRAADELVAPSAAFAEATAALYGLSRTPRVVHNGGRPYSGEVAERAAPNSQFVLTAGRLWDDGKNVSALDKVAAGLSVPILAAGPTHGPNGAAIALRHARSVGQLDRKALLDLMAQRPVFTSLAFYEPFGLAVLEAAQAGCPLVLADIPTFRELWEGAALFVNPHRPDQAEAVLREILSRPDEQLRFGRAAAERAASYTIETMVDGVLSVYAKALARPAQAGRPARAVAAA